jgi:hypothetical protein
MEECVKLEAMGEVRDTALYCEGRKSNTFVRRFPGLAPLVLLIRAV